MITEKSAIPFFDEAKKIVLTGWHNNNDYNRAKTPFSNNGQWNYVSNGEDAELISKGHWLGVVIPPGYIVVDIDSNEKGKIVYEGLLQAGNSFGAIKTPNGYQSFFKDSGRVQKQSSKFLTVCGIVCDYRLASKGYIVLPSENTPEREVIHYPESPLDPMPLCFIPVRRKKETDEETEKILEGFRDDALFSHASKIREWNIAFRLNLSYEEKRQCLSEVNQIFCYPPLSGRDIDRIVDSSERYETISTPQKNNEWPDPIPVNCFDNLPEFPASIVPSPGREMIEAISEVNQVNSGMSGSLYLGVLSACVAGRAKVDLVTHKEPTNLFFCVIANSGARKSSTIRPFTEPIYAYQKQKEIDMRDIITKERNKRKIDEQRLSSLQKDAAKCTDEWERKKIQDEAEKIAIEINDNPLPKAPTYLVDDITSEATGDIMADNNERLSVISPEGGIFKIMAGLYNEKGGSNFDIYLKGHAGDAWSSHRIGREQKNMLSPALTMVLTVQPDVISEAGKNSQFRGRGLLARFLYSVNTSQAGTRKRQKKSISAALLNQYDTFIQSLMNIPLQESVLNLTPEASDLWDDFYNDIETEMLPGRSLETLKDWGSKLPGAVARIAGLLHFAQHGANAVNIPISVNIVSVSCAIGIYYKEHALAAFGIMQEDPKFEAAKKIISYMNRHKPETFKGRDVLRHTNLKGMDDVNKGLKVLLERSYIREAINEYVGMGRPEAVTYEVNKKIYMLEKQ